MSLQFIHGELKPANDDRIGIDLEKLSQRGIDNVWGWAGCSNH